MAAADDQPVRQSALVAGLVEGFDEPHKIFAWLEAAECQQKRAFADRIPLAYRCEVGGVCDRLETAVVDCAVDD